MSPFFIGGCMDWRKPVAAITVASATLLTGLTVLEGDVLTAYKDSVGIWTISRGITKGVKPGMKITQDQSDQMTSYEVTLRGTVLKSLIKVPIHQYEWDANMLLAWNIGIGNYAQSTVLKRLNKKQYKESCDAFLMWKYAGGKPILLKRRQRERLLCLGQIKKI